MTTEQLRYPIGKFKKPTIITESILAEWNSDIAGFPTRLKNEVSHLSDEQLDTQYRPDGWTIRQVVHHCADSHINAFTRFKLTLTEDKPVIRPYSQDGWAELSDAKIMPIEYSLMLLEGLHFRWANLLDSLTEQDLVKKLIHPELEQAIQLNENTAMYAWHCNHHLAHITELKKRKNWK